jgi:hypothetical protein
MSKTSLLEKLGILFEVSKSSKLFIGLLIILIIFGFVLKTTTKRNKKRNELIYIICSIFTIAFLIALYHSSLSTMFDYMMDNFFIVVYFPNLAIYLAAIIATNIIVWISVFNFKTTKKIKNINIIIYIIMTYLLALLLNVINSNNLDIFTQSSIYGNEQATALIELSATIFVLWIIFLIIYKLILIYLRKDYRPKVKKVIIRKKKLPENFEPKEVPDYIFGNAPKKQIEKVEVKEEIKDNLVLNEFDKMFTLDDYKVLLKMLKEQKEKERLEKQRQEEIESEQSKFIELQNLYRSVR